MIFLRKLAISEMDLETLWILVSELRELRNYIKTFVHLQIMRNENSVKTFVLLQIMRNENSGAKL